MSASRRFEEPQIDRIPRSSRELMGFGLSVLDLARNTHSRKLYGLRKVRIVASAGDTRFPAVHWTRTAGRKSEYGVVDKTSVGAGMLLTKLKETARREIIGVQAFVVSDDFPYKGLRRFVNCSLPFDVAPGFIEDLETSVVRVDVNNHPPSSLIVDYRRAIASIYEPINR